MRKLLMILLLGGFVYTCLLGPPLQAQNAVVNPFFSTMNMKYWHGDDPSLACSPGSINLGMDWYCLRKNPGTPDNNGSVTQDVHLIAGYTYQFSANIAAVYNCPG